MNQETLKYLTRYVWWEKPDEIIKKNPLRVIASAMRYANSVDSYKKLLEIGEYALKETLSKAQAGWFDKPSWHYWHYILYGLKTKIPPFPKRGFLQDSKDSKDSSANSPFSGRLGSAKSAGEISSNDSVPMIADADIHTLLATKLKAICYEANYKDYLDIANILKHTSANLLEGLENVSKIFGEDYPLIQILKRLTFFEDGDLYKLQQDDKIILLQAIEATKPYFQPKTQENANCLNKPQ
ncbi:hypothetical protein BA723_04295 [Helicobacter sp. CLO-3]|uniref:hypothetical protein n=1 Tax=Helicobacter sp. CLO-3 TaxID=211 RepID=UPI0008053BB4|nr:hypothetical protein [Helicobacter sp. CLO-3]OBV29722.1 hypothetical protein BA723_04295 [Helicobacter sp. CLO-3]